MLRKRAGSGRGISRQGYEGAEACSGKVKRGWETEEVLPPEIIDELREGEGQRHTQEMYGGRGVLRQGSEGAESRRQKRIQARLRGGRDMLREG